jgi:23S rRNA pseudouridine955/2504/2580 synthase
MLFYGGNAELVYMSRIQNKKTEVRYCRIEAGQAGRRIDNFLSSQFKGLPRTRLYRMLRKGEVRVNGKRIRQDYRLQPGDRVRLPPVTPAAAAAGGEPPEYLLERVRDSILYEDEHLLALNKPAGIVVHSGSGRSFGVIEIMRYLRPDEDLQLVHRLDRETSGVLLLARDYPTLKALQSAFAEGRVQKRYLALLTGSPDADQLTVDRPLARNLLRSGERLAAVSPDGKHAVTRFTVIQRRRDLSLVEAEPGTGRTHQIRVHAAAVGHPLAGDDKYGDNQVNRALRQRGLKRLFLHAAAVTLPPVLDRPSLTLEAPLPADLADFLRADA